MFLRLSSGRSVRISREDSWAKKYTWSDLPNGAENRKLGFLSKAIASRMRGRPVPKAWRVFRLDRDRDNYCRSNLLPAPPRGRSLVPRDRRRGVTYYQGKWRATCMIGRRHVLARVFKRRADAWRCRRDFLTKHNA